MDLLVLFAPLRLCASFHLPGNATTTASYSYDPNGNAIQRTYSDSRWVSGSSPYYYINYAYDFENRLVSSQGSDSAGNVSAFSNDIEYFTYDYRTRRVQQEEVHSYRGPGSSSWATSDVKTASVFSGGTAIREYSESQSPSAGTWLASNTALTPSAEFIRGSDWGGGVGGILYAIHQSGTGSGDAGVNYYHYDGRGDVVAQTTGFNGTLSYQAAYTAFGEHSPAAPSDPNMSGPPNSVVVQGFGAEEWTASGAQTDHFRKNTKEESDSGLMNEGQRYFNPELGRFMTRDPLGFADGTNPYAYVHDNPWTNFDPEGLTTGKQYDDDYAAYSAAQSSQQKDADALQAKIKSGNDPDIDRDQLLLDGAQMSLRNISARLVHDKAGKQNLVEVSQRFNFWAQAFGKDTRLDAETLDDNGKDPRYNLAVETERKVQSRTEIPKDAIALILFVDGINAMRSAAALEDAGGAHMASVNSQSFKVTPPATPVTGGQTFPVGGAASKTEIPAGVGGCFAAGTLIYTESGLKPIEAIQKDDQVWSYDFTQGKNVLQNVLRTFTHTATGYAQVQIGSETVTATLEHPFWVENVGWVGAGSLTAGEMVKAIDGTDKAVVAVQIFAADITVYNFEVENTHAYFVSGAGLLVHNASELPPGGKPTQMVDISKLRTPASQPFADPLKLQAHGPFDWAKYDPIEVQQESSGTLRIMNGVTRVQNAQNAGITQLPAYVFQR